MTKKGKKLNKITLLKKYEKLWEKGVSEYLNQNDFDIYNWLSNKDQKEFAKIDKYLYR